MLQFESMNFKGAGTLAYGRMENGLKVVMGDREDDHENRASLLGGAEVEMKPSGRTRVQSWGKRLRARSEKR